MTNELLPKTLAVCAGCAAVANMVVVLYVLAIAMFLTTLVDMFFIWRRCRDRRNKIAAIREQIRKKANDNA